jgi:hypothetical protein
MSVLDFQASTDFTAGRDARPKQHQDRLAGGERIRFETKAEEA